MERRWQVLTVVCVGIFVSSLDLFIVNIAFPDIREDLSGASLSDLSWVLSAYAIVFAALLVPAGRWADAVGRRRAFLIGLAVFTVASGLCALATSVETLVAARVVQAAGAALLVPTSLGLLLPEFPDRERPVAIGIWAASGGVAAAAGPPVGGLLVGLGWHWVFLVNVPIGIAAFVAGARILREIREPAARRPDVPGAAMLAFGTAALVAAIVNAETWGWTDARTLGAAVGGAALLAVVGARCRTHPAPIVELDLLAVRAFPLAIAGAALFFVAFAGMLLGSVLYLTAVRGEDVLDAGLMIAPGPLAAAVASVPASRLGARVGPHAVGAVGAGLFAAGAAWWLWRLGDGASYGTDYLPALLVGGLGVALVNPAVTAAVAASVPPARFATGAALLTTGRQLGTALGVALVVPLLGAPTGAGAFDGVWTLMLAASVLAAVTIHAIGPLTAADANVETTIARVPSGSVA